MVLIFFSSFFLFYQSYYLCVNYLNYYDNCIIIEKVKRYSFVGVLQQSILKILPIKYELLEINFQNYTLVKYEWKSHL